MKSSCWPSGVIASTATPTAVTVKPAPSVAVFDASNHVNPSAAPTLRSQSSSHSAVPAECAEASRFAVPLTTTSPLVAVMLLPSRIRARFCTVTQLNAMAAATSTAPPDAPEVLCACPFAPAAVVDGFGVAPPA